jgi:hypothetical protein
MTFKYTNVNVISIIPKNIDIPIYRKFKYRVIGIYKNPIIIGISIYRNSLTLTVFKNTHLLRRSSQSPPIMLGPVFFHWDGSCSTYQRFFSHIRTKLDTNINTEIGLSVTLLLVQIGGKSYPEGDSTKFSKFPTISLPAPS